MILYIVILPSIAPLVLNSKTLFSVSSEQFHKILILIFKLAHAVIQPVLCLNIVIKFWHAVHAQTKIVNWFIPLDMTEKKVPADQFTHFVPLTKTRISLIHIARYLVLAQLRYNRKYSIIITVFPRILKSINSPLYTSVCFSGVQVVSFSIYAVPLDC